MSIASPVKEQSGVPSPLSRNIYVSERERLSLRVFKWFERDCQLRLNKSELLSDLFNDYECFCTELGVVSHSKKLFSSLLMDTLQVQREEGSIAKVGKGKVTIKGVEIKIKK